MKGISKREKIMVLILGIVFIGYLYYSLFYAQVQKKIESAKLNINNYIAEINDAKMNKELFEEQTSQLESIKEKYEEAKLILPQIEMNPEILANIQKFFLESGVKVTNITLGEPEEMQDKSDQSSKSTSTKDTQSTENLLTVPVTISLTADSYEEVMKFIYLFENDKRYAEITNIAITANRSVSSSLGESTKKPVAVETQPVNNEIQVLVVGEGEEYKETFINGENNNKYNYETIKQVANVTQPEQKSINFGEPKPRIEVTLLGRYYYTNSNE